MEMNFSNAANSTTASNVSIEQVTFDVDDKRCKKQNINSFDALVNFESSFASNYGFDSKQSAVLSEFLKERLFPKRKRTLLKLKKELNERGHELINPNQCVSNEHENNKLKIELSTSSEDEEVHQAAECHMVQLKALINDPKSTFLGIYLFNFFLI